MSSCSPDLKSFIIWKCTWRVNPGSLALRCQWFLYPVAECWPHWISLVCFSLMWHLGVLHGDNLQRLSTVPRNRFGKEIQIVRTSVLLLWDISKLILKCLLSLSSTVCFDISKCVLFILIIPSQDTTVLGIPGEARSHNTSALCNVLQRAR